MPRRGKVSVNKGSGVERIEKNSATPVKSVTKRLRKCEPNQQKLTDKPIRKSKACEETHFSKNGRSDLAPPEPDFAALVDIDLNGERSYQKEPKNKTGGIHVIPEALTPKKTLPNIRGYKQLPQSPTRSLTKEGIPAFPIVRRAVARVAPTMWNNDEMSTIVVQTKTPMRGIDSSECSDDERDVSEPTFDNSGMRQGESGPMDSPVRSYLKPSPPRSQSPMHLSPMKFPPTPIINNSKYWTGEKVQVLDDEENVDPEVKQVATRATVKRRLKSCMGNSYMTIDEICEMPCNPLSPVLLEPPLLYLSLPSKLRDLNECFKSVLVVMCTSSESGLEVIFKKSFIQMVQKMMNNRRLTLIEIQQILWLVPSMMEAKWIPSKDNKDYELKLINKKLPSEVKLGRLDTEYRRKVFRSMLVLWTALHHDAVLVSMSPPIKPPARESMQGWHPDFELEQVSMVPAIKLDIKPQRRNSISPSKRIDSSKSVNDNGIEDCTYSILPPSLRRRHNDTTNKKKVKNDSETPTKTENRIFNDDFNPSYRHTRSPSPINFKTDSMIKLRERAEKLREAKEIRDKLSREEEKLFDEMQEKADMIRVLESIHAYFGQSTAPRVVLLPILVTYISRLPLRPPITPDQANKAIKTLQEHDSNVISITESTTFPSQKLITFNPSKKSYTQLLNTCHDELNSCQRQYSDCRKNIPGHFKQIWVEKALTEEPHSFLNGEVEAWASCPTPFRE